MKSKILLFFLLFSGVLMAQEADLTGQWKGHIQTPQMKLEVEFDLEQKGKKEVVGTMSVPIQQLKGLPITDVEWDRKEQKLKFKVPDVPGNAGFRGKLNAAGDSLNGTWTQSMMSMPTFLGRPSAQEQEEEQMELAEKVERYRGFLDSLLDAADVPGISIAVVYEGNVIMEEGRGMRDVKKELPVDAETRFAIGSCSKAFTSFGLSVLAEEGKLDFEAPVQEYMPEFRLQDDYISRHMSTIDLLTHRSGLPRHDFAWYGSQASREELFARLPYLELSEGFRAKWQYQNFMYMTAGMLAGKVSGSSWEEVVQTRIFNPLGMGQSTLNLKGLTEIDNAALGYSYDGDKKEYVELPYRNIDAIGPAGSINSNAKDMAKWVQVHLQGGKFNGQELIAPVSLNRIWTSYMPTGSPGSPGIISPVSYGLGWMNYHFRGHQAHEHGGNIDGFSAMVFLMPEDDFGVAILTNKNGTPATSSAVYQAADLFLDLGDTDWLERLSGGGSSEEAEVEPIKSEPIPGTQSSHELKDYTGTFMNPGYGTMDIEMREDTLYATFNTVEYKLEHWHYDVFKGSGSFIEQLFNFRTDNDGYIESVHVPFEVSVDPIEFEMQAPPILFEPAFMERITGVYDLKVLEATIRKVGNKLYAIAPGQPDYELVPLRGTTYAFKGLDGFSIEFEIDVEGKDPAQAIVVRQPNVTLKGERKE